MNISSRSESIFFHLQIAEKCHDQIDCGVYGQSTKGYVAQRRNSWRYKDTQMRIGRGLIDQTQAADKKALAEREKKENVEKYISKTARVLRMRLAYQNATD